MHKLQQRNKKFVKQFNFATLADDKPLITGFNDINGSNAGPKFNIAFLKKLLFERMKFAFIQNMIVYVLSYYGREL
jgi:hypothetical protein